MTAHPPDSVEFFVGARKSGKSTMMKESARRFRRVLVFSPLEKTNCYGEFLGVEPSPTLPEFLAAVAAGGHAVWAPPHGGSNPELFDMWNKIVWIEGNCLALADELAGVSRPGKAVGWWGENLMFGRHRGICIAAGAQRPTEVDSTIRGNTSRVCVFRLGKLSDKKLMADEIGVDVARVKALRQLEFLDCDSLTGNVELRKIVFR